MSSAARLAVSWLTRAPGRTLMRLFVLAASVALLGGMLLFVANSLRTVAGSAVRSVPLDLQGPVAGDAQARSVAAEVARQRGVLQASAVATAPIAGAEHSGPAGLTSSGAGAVLAVPPGYSAHIHTYRFLQGSLQPGAIVLDQQMAATLQAHIGDRVTLQGPRRREAAKLSRVGNRAGHRAGPALPAAQPRRRASARAASRERRDPHARHVRDDPRARRAERSAAASPGANAQPGAQTGVQWQVQTQLDPAALSGGSPSTALELATQARNRIERSLPGRVQFVDNLSESLNTAAGDALYAQTLYIMLAVPGALIALGLAYLAALGTVERDRRDLALLRARGARRRDLLRARGNREPDPRASPPGVLGTAAAFGRCRCSSQAARTPPVARVLVVGAVCIVLAALGRGSGALRREPVLAADERRDRAPRDSSATDARCGSACISMSSA